jgi:ribosomal protein S18 acetylase RimI-like enzyme
MERTNRAGQGGLMGFEWCAATEGDLDFSRELTRRNMLRYYIRYDLLWQDEAFDAAWMGRENRIIMRDDSRVGYVSLSRDPGRLHPRTAHRRSMPRAGGRFLGDRSGIAMVRQERRPALRLTVFENNPARALYERKGLQVVGADECFLRMQRDVEGSHR